MAGKPEAKIGKVFENTAGIIKDNIKTFLASVAILGILFTFLYGLWKIPIIDFGFHRMAEIGIVDILYIIAITAMAGILMVLMRQKIRLDPKSSKLGGTGGLFVGFVSAVCPVCQGITIAALGGTIAFIPLGFLSSFVWILQLVSLFVLWIAVYLNSLSIYTKTCITCEIKPKIQGSKYKAEDPKPEPASVGSHFLDNNKLFAALVVIVALVITNQILLGASGFATGSGAGSAITLSGDFKYGSKITLKPMPLSTGENPPISGYKTKVKTLPTISELAIKQSTGDVVQDLVNNVVPSGTPWYGQEAGVSFDDPIAAQKLWGKGGAIQLDSAQSERWSRIVNSFTCDYCCGSPEQPTVITHCGCAHSIAAQGMAKWFIKNYGDKYSDEEIYGEMARWYALWYPGPTVKRIAQEMGLA